MGRELGAGMCTDQEKITAYELSVQLTRRKEETENER